MAKAGIGGEKNGKNRVGGKWHQSEMKSIGVMAGCAHARCCQRCTNADAKSAAA
jgi:hypothetical protein